MKDQEYFQLLHAEIRAEHELVYHRMSWYVASQAFLVGAFAVLAVDAKQVRLAIAVVILGASLSLLFWVPILLGRVAMEMLRKEEKRVLSLLAGTPPAPPPAPNHAQKFHTLWFLGSQRWIHWFSMGAPLLIPLALLVFWLFAPFLVRWA
ncbi:MAG TPA: hypothetical protein VMS17_26720 [Gemmataceae bacterium]|nr:hypothetical protein [Gemmataceae bacterium]